MAISSRAGSILKNATGWDRWLAAEMVAARALHGIAFEVLYADAPVWRFVLPGECGAFACSADSVGRLFPLLCGVRAEEADDALAERCEDRLYDAFAGGWTADRLHETLAEGHGGGTTQGRTGWWTEGNATFAPAACQGRRPKGLIGMMLMRERGA